MQVPYQNMLTNEPVRRAPLDPFLERLLVLSDQAIFILSPEGRLLRLNPVAERLLGVREQDYVGQSYRAWPLALYDAEGAALGLLDIEGTLTAALTGERNDRELLIATPAGERLPAHAHIGPVRDAQGELQGLMAVLTLHPAMSPDEPDAMAARAAYLQGMFEQLPVGVIILDAVQGPVEANAAACRLVGARPGELDSDFLWGRVSAVQHADGRPISPQEAADIWRAAADGRLHTFCAGLAVDGGDLRWLEATAQPLPDGGGQRSILVVRDVTAARAERLRLDQRVEEQAVALYQAQEQEQAAREGAWRCAALVGAQLDSAIEGVCMTGRDGRIRSWNRRFREMFALPIPPAETISWEHSLPRIEALLRNPAAADAHIAAMLAAPEAEDISLWELHDGRMLALHTLPVRQGQGAQIIGRLWILRDISERRRITRRIEEQRAFLQAILDFMPANVYVRDEQQRYLLANRATARAYGMTVAQMLGKTDAELRTAVGCALPTPASMSESDRQILSGEKSDVLYEFPAGLSIRGVADYLVAKTAFTWQDGRRVVLGISQDITELRKAEHALRERQQLVQEIIELLPANVFLKDRHCRYVLANHATAAMLGTTVDELIGHTDAELAAPWGAPERIAEAERTDRLVLDDAEQGVYELALRGPDAMLHIYRITKRPFTYQGEPAILGVGFDVTRQRQAEQRVSAQRDWFQRIFDFMPGDVFVRDAAGRYVLANHNLATAYRVEQQELIGKTHAELTTVRNTNPVWAEQIASTDHAILAGKTSRESYIFYAPNGDGYPSQYLITKVPFELEDGSPAVLGISVDITRQREADLMEQQLQLIYDSVPVGIAVLDKQGAVLRANRRLAEILQVRLQAIEGINILTHPATHLNPLAPDLARCLEHGAEAVGETDISTANAGEVHIRYGLAARREAAGQISGALVIIEDITSYRHLQERLRQAAKLEALGQLAGGTAHSFRNLLTVINGYTEMTLLNKRLGDRVRGDLNQVLAAGQRAADLARQLLTFSRHTELELSVFDLNEMLRDMSRMLRPLLSDAVTLNIELSEQALLVHADRAQMEQMVINLAVNAHQAMPQGGALTITTRACRLTKPNRTQYLNPQPGRYALLEVSDTGAGISPEVRQHLFEPFFTTKPEGEGTGLGLSMAYGLMQGLGGGIDVHSTSGRGARFRFYIPRVSVAEATSAQATARKRLPRARSGELLLVVDSDEAARQLLVRMLSLQLGYTVFDAAGGAEALELCEELREPFRLVLTDVSLPDMTGAEMVRRLKERCQTHQVLYVTALSAEALAARGDGMAQASILSRPFTLERLARAVRAALDADAATAQPAKMDIR